MYIHVNQFHLYHTLNISRNWIQEQFCNLSLYTLYILCVLYPFIHSVFCLTTGPKPLTTPALHTVRSRDLESILSFQGHPVASYVFNLVFPSLLSPFYLSFNKPLQKAVYRQNVAFLLQVRVSYPVLRVIQ